ncbi:MAG: hypothetical protein Q8P88_03205 [Candidatus Jorgensenbacteria bacterium]|nr:hypothetical protein [Candidatus Jorgensenbacteria bacterium]
MPSAEGGAENINERADLYVKKLLDTFTKNNLPRFRRGERGLIEQELEALTDQTIGALVKNEGKEFAHAVARRITDEIEFCSTAFAEYADQVKTAVAEAEEKYGIKSPPAEELREAA